MINTSTQIAAGLALSLGVACGGPRTDRPVVTTTDQGRTASKPGTDRTLLTAVAYKRVTSYAEIRDNTITFRLRPAGNDSSLSLVATLSLVDRP